MKNKLSMGGFTLVEILVASVIGLFVTIGALQVLFYFLAQMDSVKLGNVINSVNLDAQFVLTDEKAWTLTTMDPKNTTMKCLQDSLPCNKNPLEGQPFILFDKGSRVIADSLAATAGFDRDGNICNGFNQGTANNACPLRLELFWSPICAGAACIPNQVIVSGVWKYGGPSSEKKLSLDLAKFNFKTRVNQFKQCVLPWGGSIDPGQSFSAYNMEEAIFPAVCPAPITRSCATDGNLTGDPAYKFASCTNKCTPPWGGAALAEMTKITAFNATSITEPGTCASISLERQCKLVGTLGWDGADTFDKQTCHVDCNSLMGGPPIVKHGVSVVAWQASEVPQNGVCLSEVRTCNEGAWSPGTAVFPTCARRCNLPWGGSISSGTSVTAYLATNIAVACTPETRWCNDGILSGSFVFPACVTTWVTGTCGGNVPEGAVTGICSAGNVAGFVKTLLDFRWNCVGDSTASCVSTRIGIWDLSDWDDAPYGP